MSDTTLFMLGMLCGNVLAVVAYKLGGWSVSVWPSAALQHARAAVTLATPVKPDVSPRDDQYRPCPSIGPHGRDCVLFKAHFTQRLHEDVRGNLWDDDGRDHGTRAARGLS